MAKPEDGTMAAVFRASFSVSASSYSPRHFLNEERNSISTLDNVLPNTLGESLVAHNTVDHSSDFALAKTIETECSDVGPSYPGRVELRAICDDQQHAKGSQPVHCTTQHFKAGWIDPMHILENHQHWLDFR